jgi:hypothetical protein
LTNSTHKRSLAIGDNLTLTSASIKELRGGVDYVEVDSLLKNGLPIKRLREKLKGEIPNLQENDRLIYIDKTDPSKRIVYDAGENPSVIDSRPLRNE